LFTIIFSNRPSLPKSGTKIEKEIVCDYFHCNKSGTEIEQEIICDYFYCNNWLFIVYIGD
jgi:hypothetical protein